jgi:hypothetical protein
MLWYTKFTWIETIENNIIFWIPLILTTPIQSDERLPEVGISALGSAKTASSFLNDRFYSAGAHSNIDPLHSNARVVHAGSCVPTDAVMKCGDCRSLCWTTVSVGSVSIARIS